MGAMHSASGRAEYGLTRATQGAPPLPASEASEPASLWTMTTLASAASSPAPQSAICQGCVGVAHGILGGRIPAVARGEHLPLSASARRSGRPTSASTRERLAQRTAIGIGSAQRHSRRATTPASAALLVEADPALDHPRFGGPTGIVHAPAVAGAQDQQKTGGPVHGFLLFLWCADLCAVDCGARGFGLRDLIGSSHSARPHRHALDGARRGKHLQVSGLSALRRVRRECLRVAGLLLDTTGRREGRPRTQRYVARGSGRRRPCSERCCGAASRRWPGDLIGADERMRSPQRGDGIQGRQAARSPRAAP